MTNDPLSIIDLSQKSGPAQFDPVAQEMIDKLDDKRVHWVYCEMKLSIKRRTKKRVITRPRQPLDCPKEINEVWSLDFVRDMLYDGKP
jgi:hypothetical protein